MKPSEKRPLKEVVKTISHERERTNILRKSEQMTIAYLVQRIPSWISSDMLTAIGFMGSVIIFISFMLANYVSEIYLLIGVVGFFISWFGDSLDGRIAYFRNIPRKWYGFTLDLSTDWIGAILIGLGFVIYAEGPAKLLGFIFVVLYGWEIMTTLLRYKVSGVYSIDSGILGPTEVRIIISSMLIMEVIIDGTFIYFAALACVVLFVTNISDFFKLLTLANNRDREEREQKRKDAAAL